MTGAVKLPELLSPVRDREALEAAVAYGADAVYLGGTAFGMRATAANFDAAALREAVRFAHSKGVKVYLTCNTIPTQSELGRIKEFVFDAARSGVDAFIITDLGVFSLVSGLDTGVDIHISTQAGVMNSAAANMLHTLGASRVVTAREMSLEDVAALRARTSPELEIECFVHGAMCVSFSGRCLLSNYLTGRDSNRGDCAQPCRWKYTLTEESRPDEFYPIEQDEGGTYIMNSRDMCMIEHIPELVSAGISSFKLEGRAKTAYYTAVVTNAYRAALDAYAASPSQDFVPPAWAVAELDKISHREYCTGFWFGSPRDCAQIFSAGGYIRNWDIAAVVTHWHNGIAECTQRNRFFDGDLLSVLTPGAVPFEVTADNLRDVEGNPIPGVPHPLMPFNFDCPTPIPDGAILRIRKG